MPKTPIKTEPYGDFIILRHEDGIHAVRLDSITRLDFKPLGMTQWVRCLVFAGGETFGIDGEETMSLCAALGIEVPKE